jgi:hypothetical protein
MVDFEFEDKNYRLEFRRQHKEVELVRRASGDSSKVKKVKSLHPYTTATLWLVPKSAHAPSIQAQATVGCATIDTFAKAKGREEALKALARVLRTTMRSDKHRQQELTKHMWNAYINRPKGSPCKDGTCSKCGQVLPKKEEIA